MKRLSLTLLFLAACADKADEPLAPPPPPPPPVSKAWVFQGEPTTGPSLRLDGDISGDTLSVDIVGQELNGLYGVAFRISYDPAVLTFAGLQATETWPMMEIAEAQPGLVVVTLSNMGPAIGMDVTGALATATFERIDKVETFVAAFRPFALDPDGDPIALTAGRGSLRFVEVGGIR